MPIRHSLLLLPLLTLAGPVTAEEFVVPAGNWQMTVTTTNPFMPNPVTRTRTECRPRAAFDPSELIKDAEDCRITQQDVSASVLTFRMICDSQTGKLTGSGRYEINGDQAKGYMDMSMDMQGQTMKMRMDMVGERLGDC